MSGEPETHAAGQRAQSQTGAHGSFSSRKSRQRVTKAQQVLLENGVKMAQVLMSQVGLMQRAGHPSASFKVKAPRRIVSASVINTGIITQKVQQTNTVLELFNLMIEISKYLA